MNTPRFGGTWTEQKLSALEKYLSAYLNIFTGNRVAAKFTRHYVDAFAGSGWRSVPDANNGSSLDLGEAIGFVDGSVRKVLSIDKAFHRYHFVEQDPGRLASLKNMINEDFPVRFANCGFHHGDANDFLFKWASELNQMDRAVVFLDPFGMSVQWTTIEKLASTKKVDLWMLFPASSVIRMLPRKGPPGDAWAQRLTKLFGDESWRDEFYQEGGQGDLFGEESSIIREVSVETVSRYLLRRLKNIFSGVADQPLVLKNSRNSPLFLLVFAAGNEHGAGPAVSIASHIIKNA